MYDQELAKEISIQIHASIEKILRRFRILTWMQRLFFLFVKLKFQK